MNDHYTAAIVEEITKLKPLNVIFIHAQNATFIKA